ncbi:MAG: MoaF N-terminal domain-containing protein, partial [Oscillospiraceae bacterium]|nr:MoaF N-terminal domain-containing protein [Oscillospiraceae bacterium]
MDLRQLSKFGGGSIDQYTPPLCFELVGERLELIMDNGYDITLSFLDKNKLEWSYAGETPKTEEYKCLKADDTTYLVSFELADVTPRVNYAFVIDEE